MAALTLNTLSLVSGQPVTITSGTATLSAGSDPVWSNEERDAALDAALALTAGGTIEIGTTAFASVLAIFTVNTPSHDPASGGSAALDVTGMTVNASNTGTAAVYRYKTSGGQVRRQGAVGT